MKTNFTDNEKFFLENIELTNNNLVNYTPDDLEMETPNGYDEDAVIASLIEKDVLEQVATNIGTLYRVIA